MRIRRGFAFERRARWPWLRPLLSDKNKPPELLCQERGLSTAAKRHAVFLPGPASLASQPAGSVPAHVRARLAPWQRGPRRSVPGEDLKPKDLHSLFCRVRDFFIPRAGAAVREPLGCPLLTGPSDRGVMPLTSLSKCRRLMGSSLRLRHPTDRYPPTSPRQKQPILPLDFQANRKMSIISGLVCMYSWTTGRFSIHPSIHHVTLVRVVVVV